MCYGASSTMVAAKQFDTSGTEPGFWKDLAYRFLFASGYPLRPSLDSIRAAFLLSASTMGEWNLNPDPTPIAVLLRASQALGLHRDPSKFQFTTREAVFRRRLWWSIYAVDLCYSLAHGLPATINPSKSDVQVIEDESNPEVRWLTFLTPINLCLARILEEIYGFSRPNACVLKRLDLDASKQSASMLQRQRRDSPQNEFIAMSTSLCWDKVVMLLHQPYLRCPSWPKDSRGKALNAAQRYVKDYSSTITSTCLIQYRWILSHWNIFHAVAIILQDLIQCKSFSSTWIIFTLSYQSLCIRLALRAG
jgi:hypothetical protein